jgi:hypothetical protein
MEDEDLDMGLGGEDSGHVTSYARSARSLRRSGTFAKERENGARCRMRLTRVLPLDVFPFGIS